MATNLTVNLAAVQIAISKSSEARDWKIARSLKWTICSIQENFEKLWFKFECFNSIQDGLFRGCSRMREGQKEAHSLKYVKHILQWWNVTQLCRTWRRSKNYMKHVTKPVNSADISIFSPEINKFCYIKRYRYRLHFDK